MADMATRTGLTDIGRGQPLVFLHGWSVDRSFFVRQHALAEEGFRIVAPDQAGHGEAAVSGGPPTISRLSDTLARLLREEDLGGAVLVGWSMGATVALDHLARCGSRGIAGLVMIDMTPKVPNAPDWPLGLADGQNLDEALHSAERMASDWQRYAPKIAAALFAAGHDPDGAELAHAREVVAGCEGGAMAHLWRSLVRADHRETIRALDIPLLSIAGSESRLYRPDVSRWIADHAPRGEAVTIADAGHAPQVEQPEAFNAAVVRFARRLR